MMSRKSLTNLNGNHTNNPRYVQQQTNYKRGGQPPLFSLLSRVQRAVDSCPGPNFRPQRPICKNFPISSKSIWPQVFPKLTQTYMVSHMLESQVSTRRQRPPSSVFPTGPTICDFFSNSSGRLYALYFPVKWGPTGLTILKKYDIILKKGICTDRPPTAYKIIKILSEHTPWETLGCTIQK